MTKKRQRIAEKFSQMRLAQNVAQIAQNSDGRLELDTFQGYSRFRFKDSDEVTIILNDFCKKHWNKELHVLEGLHEFHEVVNELLNRND